MLNKYLRKRKEGRGWGRRDTGSGERRRKGRKEEGREKGNINPEFNV